MKPTIFLGIDNGKQGAIVGVDNNENIIFKRIMPLKDKEYDVGQLQCDFKMLAHQFTCVVCLEKAYSMPYNSGKSDFKMGFQYAQLQTMMIYNDIEFVITTPQRWMKGVLKGIKAKNTKEASISFVTTKWPTVDWKRTSRCKNIHDGLADAACMALYIKKIEDEK